MKGHTPGPWRGDGTPGCEIIGNSRIVATMTWCSGFQEEDAANARLVIAAPDMLAALSAACGYLTNAHIDLTTSTPKTTTLRTIEGGIKLVKEAIAKATTPATTAGERS